MTEKLQAAENRYEELTQKLTDPDVLGNPELYKRIATEHAELEELVGVYRAYKEAVRDRDEARDLLEKPLEDEFRELVKDEYREKVLAAIEQKISGKEINSPRERSEGKVIDLMDALKKSLLAVKKPAAKKAAPVKKTPPKKNSAQKEQSAVND